MSSHPWDRRLSDLAHTIRNCSSTYFEPELFRRNVNHFLQTSRTVTFIIQKNKADITNFDTWYQSNVLDNWSNDIVMKWAKDSRNFIEKQGDLEINSTLDVKIIDSYFQEEDTSIPMGVDELLNGGVKKLVKVVKKDIPADFLSAIGIQIDRKWVCSTLATHELLLALSYVYSRVFDACKALSFHLHTDFTDTIPTPAIIADECVSTSYSELIKLSDGSSYTLSAYKKTYKRDEINESTLDSVRAQFGQDEIFNADFNTVFNFYEKSAKHLFTRDGFHQNILFLLNENWEPEFMCTPILDDRVDKYFFWRKIAERIFIQKTHCLVFVGEVWKRTIPRNTNSVPIDKWEIVGEELKLMAFDRDNNKRVITWNIFRDQTNPAEIKLIDQFDDLAGAAFLTPALKSMGLEYEHRTKLNG